MTREIVLKNLGPTATGPRLRLPENYIIQPKRSKNIPLPVLPSAATQAQAYQNLKRASFLSIAQLCDYDCSAPFFKKDVTIFKPDNNPVLNVIRNTSDGLCYVTTNSSQP